MSKMRRLFTLLYAFIIAAVLCFSVPAVSYAAGGQRDIEVLLSADAVSNNLDLAGFADKLKNKLQTTYSIPADKVHVTEVASQSYSGSGSGWCTFDHTNNSGLAKNDATNLIQYYAEGYSNLIRDRHIVFTNNNQSINFYGYGVPAYNDFLFMPNTDANNKIFTFSMTENFDYHTAVGAGFLFNASYSYNGGARTLSGYFILIGQSDVMLYQLTNVDVNAFTQGTNPTGLGTLLAAVTKPSPSSGSTRYLKLVASPTNVSLTQYTDNTYSTVCSGGSIFSNYSLATNFGSFGFGPIACYMQHGCSALSQVTFDNLKMAAESSVGFADMVKSTTWQYDDSFKIIANVDNDGVPDFGNPAKLSTILYYMMLNNVHYAGWGLNNSINIGGFTSVKAQADAFTLRNMGNGTFINRSSGSTDTLDEGVDTLAAYIAGKLSGVSDVEKPTISTQIADGQVTCTGPDTLPDGGDVAGYKWSYMDVSDGQWHESSDTTQKTFTFTPGDYNFVSLSVQDESGEWSEPATAYVSTDVSAPPISQFMLDENELMPDSIDELKTGSTVTATDLSYHPSGAALTDWEWKVYDSTLHEVSALAKTYTNATKPASITFDFSGVAGGTYTIKEKVSKSGIASDYFSQQVLVIKESSDITIARTAPSQGTQSYTGTLGVSWNITSNTNPVTAYRLIKLPTGAGSAVIGDWTNCNSKNLNESTTLSSGSYKVYVQAKDSFGNSKTGLLGTYTMDTTPHISPTSINFNKNTVTADCSDKTIALTLNGNTLTGLSSGGTDLPADSYSVDGTNVTLKKEWLADCENGTKTVTFTFSGGTCELTVNISDTSPKVSAAKTDFDKNTTSTNHADLAFDVTLNGNTFTGVKYGSSTLTAADYTWDGSKATITKEYLSTLSPGKRAITFVFAEGNEPKVDVTITDTTPDIEKTSANFDKNLVRQADIAIGLDLNGNALTAIKLGSTTLDKPGDYTLADGTITLKKEWLATLETGKAASLELDFAEGNIVNFTINVSDTTPGVDITAATFDKNPDKQKDISITVDFKDTTLSSIKNGSHDLAVDTEYSLAENVISIKKAYLATKSIGATEEFEVGFASGNTQKLSITIINTAKPEIKLKGENPLTLELGSAYTEAGAKVSDPYDDDIQSKLVIAGEVDTFKTGNYTITYDAKNKDGNSAERQVRTVVVADTITPRIDAPSLSPAGWTSRNVTVSMKISDLAGIDKVKWKAGSAEGAAVIASGQEAKQVSVSTSGVSKPQSGKWSFVATDNGTYTVAAADVNGLVKTATVSISNIDTVPASIMASPSSGGWSKKIDVDVAASDGESDIKKAEYAWSEGSVPSAGWSLLPADGKVSMADITGIRQLHVRATDSAGNLATETFGPYKLDNTKPEGAATLTEDAQGGKVSIKFTATDEHSGVKSITLPDGTVKQGAESEYTAYFSKEYPFTVTDAAGNEAIIPVAVTVPALPEKVDITGTMRTQDGATAPNVKVELLDENGKVIATTTTDENGHYTLPQIPPGEYDIVVGGDTAHPIPVTISAGQGASSITQNGVGFNVDKDTKDVYLNLSTSDKGTAPANMSEPGMDVDAKLQVKMTDEQGNATPGQTYVLKGPDGSVIATATSDANGVVTFDNVPAGAYTLVSVDGQNNETGSVNVNIRGGSQAAQNMGEGNIDFVVNEGQNVCKVTLSMSGGGGMKPKTAEVTSESKLSFWVIAAIAGGGLLILALVLLLILRKKKVYQAGDRPGTGTYACTQCKTKQRIENKDEALATCANCGNDTFTK